MAGLQAVLDHLNRLWPNNQNYKEGVFRSMIKRYFEDYPIYNKRFTKVWLWDEWLAFQGSFEGPSIGIDLVAEECNGGYCAILCKYRSNRSSLIFKEEVDPFISASARDLFTGRILVTTGNGLEPEADRAIRGLKPECQVFCFEDLDNSDFDWDSIPPNKPKILTVQKIRILPNDSNVSGVFGTINKIEMVRGHKATLGGHLTDKNGQNIKIFFCRKGLEENLERLEGRKVLIVSNKKGEGILKREFKDGTAAIGVFPEAKIR